MTAPNAARLLRALGAVAALAATAVLVLVAFAAIDADRMVLAAVTGMGAWIAAVVTLALAWSAVRASGRHHAVGGWEVVRQRHTGGEVVEEPVTTHRWERLAYWRADRLARSHPGEVGIHYTVRRAAS